MKRIALLTNNDMLYRRIMLILRDRAEVIRTSGRTDADLLVIDKESYPSLDLDGYTLPYTERGGRIYNLPVSHRELISAVENVDKSQGRTLSLDAESREATLGGEQIRLTEVEARLLTALFNAEGYLSREELLKSVWGEGTDRGVVNVYIHYLREKLERGGDKIILSSRSEGYMIDKRFKGGKNAYTD